MTEKMTAGASLPEITLPRVGGGEVTLGGARDRWQLVVVYRGRHCPICSRYLAKLEGLTEAFGAANTDVVAVSADTAAQGASAVEDWGLGFDVGYGLDSGEMRALGLYVSDPRSEAETDHQFPEPGLFLVNPEGKAHIIDISNAPFSRPDLEGIANALGFIQDKGYPIRGTAA